MPFSSHLGISPWWSHPTCPLHLLSAPQAMPALLQQVLISPHLTGVSNVLLDVASALPAQYRFSSAAVHMVTRTRKSPFKPSLPLFPPPPIPVGGQIPRIATTLKIHSFFAILTSTLTSSALRAYHLHSLDIPKGFLTGSVEL